MIDQEKIGKFIAALRKEKGLTQEQLAEILFVGREAVSKWERGVSLPSHSLLVALSEYFDISINELLYGERETPKNSKMVQLISFNWFKSKLDFIKKILIGILIFFITLFITVCIIFDYNSFKIYMTYVAGENFTLNKGMIIKCRDKLYLKFGEVINHTDEEITDMKLYYGSDENKVELLSGDSMNDITTNRKELENLADVSMQEIYDNLYLEIKTEDKSEICKVEVRLDFKATLLKNSKDEPTVKNEDKTVQLDYLDIEEIKKKFTLKNGKYIYEFKHDGKKYKCLLDGNIIQARINNIDINYIIEEKSITITINGEEIIFNVQTQKCVSDNCKDYMKAINIFIDNILK